MAKKRITFPPRWAKGRVLGGAAVSQGTPPAAGSTGSAHCTNVAGQWAWRVCDQGCSGDACVTDVPGINVTPPALEYEI